MLKIDEAFHLLFSQLSVRDLHDLAISSHNDDVVLREVNMDVRRLLFELGVVYFQLR